MENARKQYIIKMVRCGKMDRKFILKMVQQSFKQYHRDLEIDPLQEEEYVKLYKQIIQIKEKTNEDLHDIVNDVIYEYLTD
jgi:hypothetical protein